MRRTLAILAAASLVILNATSATAQDRRERLVPVPAAGTVALGMSIGAAVPRDPFLKNGLDLAATAERYITPRVSVRGRVSGAWFDVTGHQFTGDARPMSLGANFVYNWEGGEFHPYVTAGAGLYRYRFTDNAIKGADNKLGANLGGGIEYFWTRHDAFTFEGVYHAIPGQVRSPMASYSPSFWTVSGGYKKYLSK